jgi:hypothetical protein
MQSVLELRGLVRSVTLSLGPPRCRAVEVDSIMRKAL